MKTPNRLIYFVLIDMITNYRGAINEYNISTVFALQGVSALKILNNYTIGDVVCTNIYFHKIARK